MDVPFARSYWVIPGRFLAGCYPGDRDPATADRKITALVDYGVDFVLNLMEVSELDHEGQPFVSYANTFAEIASSRGVQVLAERTPIVDGGTPSLEEMDQIVNRLQSMLRVERHPYVHCWGGVGRTGLVVACFLVSMGFDAEIALIKLTEFRQGDSRRSPENEEQTDFVVKWATCWKRTHPRT